MPSIEQLEEELVQYQKRHPNATLKDIKARYGENYRQMIGYVGSERGYHYLGSGKIMYQMGMAFGDAMTEMVGAD
jgi:hypothetical protein